MRVLHVISGLGRNSGGPSRSSQGLVAAECRAGVDAWIYAFGSGKPWMLGVRLYEPVGAELAAADVSSFDVVHIHGLWHPALHRVAALCRRAKVPYIVAPRGMLEPWSLQQKWLKKRIARLLYQNRDLRCAAALHATAESEKEQFRRLGFKNPVIVSPNGVNVPEGGLEDVRRTPDGRGAFRMLFMSRMHPKKGVLELVDALWMISRKPQGGDEQPRLGAEWRCELVYTVSGDFEREYEAKVKARVHELGLDDSFVFTGPLDDDSKWAAYRRSDLFVLPTYSENFGIVVAEALYAGVPVITTKGTPWSALETERCGWWIDLPVAGSNPPEWPALTEALLSAAALSDLERGEMGARGRRLVEARYTWDAVSAAMIDGLKDLDLGRRR